MWCQGAVFRPSIRAQSCGMSCWCLWESAGISVYALAHAIKVPRSRANDIVLGRRAVTTDTAMRLARHFGMSPQFWLNLQMRYDLDVADRRVRRKIEQEVAPRVAA